VLKAILDEPENRRDLFTMRSDADKREYDDDFNFKKTDQELKALETKRVKLNQAIQAANFTNTLEFRGTEISIAEALEVRKDLLSKIETITGKVKKSAFKEIVHKEERDIVHRPKQPFYETYQEYQAAVQELQLLNRTIHRLNHEVIVNFKDEA
jgi:hypothetical protein